MRRLSSLLLLILLGLMTSACGKSGKVYPLTLDDTRSLLTSSSELDILVTPGESLKLAAAGSSDNQLVWDIYDNGEPLLRFKADLSPENALSTRVVLSLEAGPSSKQAKVQKNLEERAAVRKLFLAAMEEAVSARIERRDFNYLAIHKQTVVAAAATMQELRQDMQNEVASPALQPNHFAAQASLAAEAAQQVSSAYDRRERDQSEYEREKQLEKASAPSVDLSKYNQGY